VIAAAADATTAACLLCEAPGIPTAIALGRVDDPALARMLGDLDALTLMLGGERLRAIGVVAPIVDSRVRGEVGSARATLQQDAARLHARLNLAIALHVAIAPAVTAAETAAAQPDAPATAPQAGGDAGGPIVEPPWPVGAQTIDAAIATAASPTVLLVDGAGVVRWVARAPEHYAPLRVQLKGDAAVDPAG